MIEFIISYVFELIDGVKACFTMNLSWQYLCTTFWFLLFIEFPRYYLLDMCVAVRHLVGYKRRRREDEVARMKLYIEKPLVSVIAPGKNEGHRIYKLVESLREQTYQNFEIIIVDDGSDDETPLICSGLEKAGYITKFFRMSDRGGKASAANAALYHCRGKYVVHLDADSSLDRDAVEKILLPFYKDRMVRGVGGCIKVRNAHDSICTALQAFEYIKTIQIGRTGVTMLGIYHIISGAFGAFETETLRQVGGWDIGPGLDGDLTQKLRKAGYKVAFSTDAICLTDVPTKWSALFKQRKRWSRSLVRFRIRKHSDIFRADSNFSISNFISNLEGICFDFIFNYVWILYLIQLVFANVDRLLEVMLVAWFIRLAFTVISFIVAQVVSERSHEERKLFIYIMISSFYTGYFMRITRLVAHTSEMLFHSSYKDNWNPQKTSMVARMENM